MVYSGASEMGLHLEGTGYCDYEDRVYILAINGAGHGAPSYEPRRLTPAKFKVGADWNKTLRAFCKRYGLAPDAKPGWYLACSWG